jgi:hypothetical protein
MVRKVLAGCTVLVALAAAPAFAAVEVIESGADLWHTAQGLSYTDFTRDPIPAGFFCPESAPFTARITMEGAPLATEPPGVLGTVDTVIHRLDDAVFDAEGVAMTRIQVMALSLVGSEPIDPGCGVAFEVKASLAGEQPTTEMRIVRETEDGGTYAAPLLLNVELAFTPVGAAGPRLAVRREIVLGPADGSYWTTTDQVGTNAYGEPVKVDTDGDGAPDRAMPKPSNFAAGVGFAATGIIAVPACPRGFCPGCCCHCTPTSTVPPPTWQTQPNNCLYSGHLHCNNCCKPCVVDTEPVGPVQPSL